MHIYIYTYVNIYVHIYIFTYTCTYMYINMYIYICICTYSYISGIFSKIGFATAANGGGVIAPLLPQTFCRIIGFFFHFMHF